MSKKVEKRLLPSNNYATVVVCNTVPAMNTDERLKHFTLRLHPSDINRGEELAQATGISARVHMRSAWKQYLKAHAPVIEKTNALGFQMPT